MNLTLDIISVNVAIQISSFSACETSDTDCYINALVCYQSYLFDCVIIYHHRNEFQPMNNSVDHT